MNEKPHDGTVDPALRVGEFLIGIGAMTGEQVATVLSAQENAPKRLFGEIAIEMGFVDDSAIEEYLDNKFGARPLRAGVARER